MSVNSFRTDIANLVGVPAAVIYQNIYFWCEKNKANKKNTHDGKIWTYNSTRAFAEQFSYLTDRQIRTALDKLEEAGLIISGSFNKSSYDRTKWYTCIELNEQIDLTEMSNEFDQNVEPIPDSKTDSKPKENKGSSIEQPCPIEIVEKGFEHFWKCWSDAKKSINAPNTSPKGETFDKKWKPLFNKTYFANHSIEYFKDEVNKICDFVRDAHAINGFNNFERMQTGKFLTNKQWRD